MGTCSFWPRKGIWPAATGVAFALLVGFSIWVACKGHPELAILAIAASISLLSAVAARRSTEAAEHAVLAGICYDITRMFALSGHADAKAALKNPDADKRDALRKICHPFQQALAFSKSTGTRLCSVAPLIPPEEIDFLLSTVRSEAQTLKVSKYDHVFKAFEDWQGRNKPE